MSVPASLPFSARLRTATQALAAAALLIFLLSPTTTLATAGHFQLGYGLKAKAMGGAAIAYPQDALAAASNPAGMVWIGNRVDAGIERFAADRGSEITGNTLGLTGNRDANGRKVFPVPEFGFNHMVDERHALGVSVFGNGGMTRYLDNPLGALGGSNPGGFEYVQAVVAPAIAVRLGERHSVGAALNLVSQEFAARGLEHFDSTFFSASPGNVTNRGRDRASGAGLRLGWLGRITDSLTLGATYQPRIEMDRFERYEGLLVDRGRFDIPENYGVGAALAIAPGLTLAGDLHRIRFSGVKALGARADCFLALQCLMGAADGPGSGWRDATVYKLGVAYEARPGLALRAGVAYLRQLVPADQTLLNIFAPAVSKWHFTLGATLQLSRRWELTASYMRAPRETVPGRQSIPAGFPPSGVGGGEANLRMDQSALGISLGWRY